MDNRLTGIEREAYIREIFLGIFKEDGISREDLEKAICESYSDEGIECKSINDIPMSEIQEAIMESCEAAGLQFDSFEDILEYFYKEDKKNI